MAKIGFVTLYDKGCLGVRYLSSILKKNGHSAFIVSMGRHGGEIRKKGEGLAGDDNLWIGVNEYGADLIRSYSSPLSQEDIRLLLDLLKQQQPDIVGFSLRTMFLDAAARITSEIRSSIKAPVLYGGIAATSEPEKCLEFADMACIGEGEDSILKLADAIDGKGSIEGVDNIWLKRDGRLYRNNPAPLLQEMDNIPFPDYDPENKFSISDSSLISNDTSIGNMGSAAYEIISSRGCPFACSYCCNDLLKNVYSGQKFLRRRSVDNVIAELTDAKSRYGIKSVLFKDEIFTFGLNWIEEFSKAYKEKIGLPFWCYTHPAFANEKILRLLKDCGMFSVTMGIQSGSEDILFNVFNRPTPYKKIVDAAHALDRLQLPVRPRYDIITNNPFETQEDRLKTLNLLMELPRPVNFGLTKLSFIPHTEITKKSKEGLNGRKADEKVYRLWNTLYLLNQYRFFPRPLIRFLSRRVFLQNRPWFLQVLLFPKFIQHKAQGALEGAKRIMPPEATLLLRRIRYRLKGY